MYVCVFCVCVVTMCVRVCVCVCVVSTACECVWISVKMRTNQSRRVWSGVWMSIGSAWLCVYASACVSVCVCVCLGPRDGSSVEGRQLHVCGMRVCTCECVCKCVSLCVWFSVRVVVLSARPKSRSVSRSRNVSMCLKVMLMRACDRSIKQAHM